MTFTKIESQMITRLAGVKETFAPGWTPAMSEWIKGEGMVHGMSIALSEDVMDKAWNKARVDGSPISIGFFDQALTKWGKAHTNAVAAFQARMGVAR